MAQEKVGLEKLEIGTIVTIHFRKGFGRPKKQRFEYLGITGNFDNAPLKDGYYHDGFVILAKAVDLTGTEIFDESGQQIPQALFPHTIKKIRGCTMNNPQVNCISKDCYYNKGGLCGREGIHADKESCCCFIAKASVKRL